jgi:hypothetical protein
VIAAAAPTPVLLLAPVPARVEGHGFRAGERVVVRLLGGSGSWTRTALATASGSFVVRFPVPLDRCGIAVATARGTHGDRAVARNVRECPPAAAASPNA